MHIESHMADDVILAQLGRRIARMRLNKNMKQDTLAQESGVSLPTIQRIEHGKSTSLTNMIRILRVLGSLENLNQLVPAVPVSPMMQIKSQGHTRKRASTSTSQDQGDAVLWQWDT